MAGSKSDVFEIDVLKAALGQTTTILATTPLASHIALFTVAPSDSAGGTEVTGGSYARVAASGKFGTPAAGSVSNSTAVTFPTASASWGTIVAFAVMSASTSGSVLYWGDLTSSRAIANGDTASFAIGSLVLTED